MDRDQVFDQLRRAVLRLMQEHPEVKEAVLFGSIARGEHGSRSDADVLLVLSESAEEGCVDLVVVDLLAVGIVQILCQTTALDNTLHGGLELFIVQQAWSV